MLERRGDTVGRERGARRSRAPEQAESQRAGRGVRDQPRRRQAARRRGSRRHRRAEGRGASGPAPGARPLSTGARAPPAGGAGRRPHAFRRGAAPRAVDRGPVSRLPSRCGTHALAAIGVLGLCAAMGPDAASQDTPPLGFAFTNIAREAGLSAVTVFGGEGSNRYLLETTGCGVALFDYDNDGRLDIFIVNGTTLEGFPKGQAPISHLYRNRGDGTFEDVTAKAGVGVSGWGQGAAAADYDNDGDSDLFVTFYGQNRLFRNDGDGTFTDVTARAGLATSRTRWGTGAAFIDYDRDGRLNLFVANYIDLDLAKAPTPDSGLCRYKGIRGRLRSTRAARRRQRALPQQGRRHLRRCLRTRGHPQGRGTLRSRRQHVRLRRRWLDRRLRRERFEPERALSQQSRRHVHGHRRPRRLRLQPGRQAAGRHGRGHRRLRSQRHLRHRQDELRRRHDDAVRQPRSRLLRGPDVRQPASASTRDGSAGARDSSTSTTTAGSTSSSSTAMSIPR